MSWLLDMAAFLEVQPLQEACCEVRLGLVIWWKACTGGKGCNLCL